MWGQGHRHCQGACTLPHLCAACVHLWVLQAHAHTHTHTSPKHSHKLGCRAHWVAIHRTAGWWLVAIRAHVVMRQSTQVAMMFCSHGPQLPVRLRATSRSYYSSRIFLLGCTGQETKTCASHNGRELGAWWPMLSTQ